MGLQYGPYDPPTRFRGDRRGHGQCGEGCDVVVEKEGMRKRKGVGKRGSHSEEQKIVVEDRSEGHAGQVVTNSVIHHQMNMRNG